MVVSEKQDAQLIQRKVEEIKNAEKQLRIVEKEIQSLKKKEAKLRDPDYIKNLSKQIQDNKKKMEQLQRDNINLKKQQKKTERLIAKKEQYQILHPDQTVDPEVQELDNEIAMLQHKLQQAVEKEQAIQGDDQKQREMFQKLRVQELRLANKEIKMIEMAKRQYQIDFSDHQRIIEEARGEEMRQEKQQLLKRLAIVKQAMETNKKGYQGQMKVMIRRQNEKEKEKKVTEDSLRLIEGDIKRAGDDLNRRREIQQIVQKQRRDIALSKSIQDQTPARFETQEEQRVQASQVIGDHVLQEALHDTAIQSIPQHVQEEDDIVATVSKQLERIDSSTIMVQQKDTEHAQSSRQQSRQLINQSQALLQPNESMLEVIEKKNRVDSPLHQNILESVGDNGFSEYHNNFDSQSIIPNSQIVK